MKGQFRIFVIVLSLPVALMAQVPIGQVEPRFRAGVELVQMDVYVSDADGRPVVGLTADDFDVFENGKRQTIKAFTTVNIPFERDEPLVADVEADVQTNTRLPGHIYMFILAETDPDIALRTRHLVRQFIDQHFGDNDIGTVVTARTYPGDRQDFTSNRRLLLNAVDRFSGDRFTDEFAELADLMEMFARIPGARKTVLWFGTNPDFDPYEFKGYRGTLLTRGWENMHAAFTAAARGNIRFFMFDPKGLTTELGLIVFPHTGDMTGGFDLVNSNNFVEHFERAVRETSTFYLLGFESQVRPRQGEMIQVEVKVKRPGLTVRSRKAYLEPLRANLYRMRPEPSRTLIEAALNNPMTTPGVPMRVTAAAYRDTGRNAAVTLTIDLDASQLTFTGKNGVHSTSIELWHLATDVNHKVFAEYRHRATISLDDSNYQRVLAAGVQMVSTFDVPANNRYQVRVGTASGPRNGSVVYDLEVPDYEKVPISLGGLVIARLSPSNVVTLRPGVVRKTQKAKQCRLSVCEPTEIIESTLQPWKAGSRAGTGLLDDVLPAPPTTAREFSVGETIALYTEVYSEKPSTAAVSATIAVLQDKDGVTVREVAARQPLRRASGGVGILVTMPLDDLPAGAYALGIRVGADVDEAHAAQRFVPIRLVSPR